MEKYGWVFAFIGMKVGGRRVGCEVWCCRSIAEGSFGPENSVWSQSDWLNMSSTSRYGVWACIKLVFIKSTLIPILISISIRSRERSSETPHDPPPLYVFFLSMKMPHESSSESKEPTCRLLNCPPEWQVGQRNGGGNWVLMNCGSSVIGSPCSRWLTMLCARHRYVIMSCGWRTWYFGYKMFFQ